MSQSQEQKAKAFEAALNRHGFALQYAVAQSAKELARFGFSNWFPFVPSSRSGFRVLTRGLTSSFSTERSQVFSWSRPRERTRPWPTGALRSRDSAVWALLSSTQRFFAKSGASSFTEVRHGTGVDAIYDVAVEASTGEKGDERGSRSGAIEDAVGQVCRGLNGLIEYFRLYGHVDAEPFEFFPVVVTTAELLTTAKPLTESDLSTGRVDPRGRSPESALGLLPLPSVPWAQTLRAGERRRHVRTR